MVLHDFRKCVVEVLRPLDLNRYESHSQSGSRLLETSDLLAVPFVTLVE
jgi:hypothetical protein